MQTSKSLLLKAFLVMNVLALAACDLPSPSKKSADAETVTLDRKGFTNSGSGTFTVELATGKSSMLEAQTKGTFQLPTAKIYNIVACLKDVAYNKPIQGHKFKIQELEQETRTDAAGCLTWKESINYNFLGDSKYLRFDRHILGTGLHRGSRLVTFAINPWSHGENLTAVLEIKANTEIPQLIEEASAVEKALKGHPRSLWVEDGRLFMTEQKFTKAGVDLMAEFRTNPSLQLTKMNGELFMRPLTAGSFKARLKVIHSYMHNDKEIRRLLGQSQAEDVTMANGSLSVKQVISLPAIPTRGQIFIGVELVPLNGPADLTSFEGIYLLGDYDTLKSTSFLKLSSLVGQAENFKISDFVNAEAPTVSAGKADTGLDPALDSDAYQKPKIEFKYVDSPSYRYLADKETTATRTVRVNLHTCLVNGIDQKIMRSHTFKVTKFKEDGSSTTPEVADVKTDNSSNGCLTWFEDITFKAFDCHRYLKGTVKIENADLGISETLNIALNPWDTYAVVRDMRSVQANENLLCTCAKAEIPRTVLYLDGYSYSTNSFDYSVDSMLNLTVHKKIQLRMDPRLLVYSSTSQGRGDPQKLRDGVYLLKAAIIRNKDYDTENSLVAYDQKLVNVQAGQLNTEMTFSTKDLRSIGNRNNMVIELYPVVESKIKLVDGKLPTDLKKLELDYLIDTDAKLESSPYIGPVTLNQDEAARPLRVLDSTMISSYFVNGKMTAAAPLKSLTSQLVAQGREMRAQVRSQQVARYSTAAFAKDNNLDLVNLEQLDPKAPLAQQFAKPEVIERLIPTRADLQELITSGTLTNTTAQKMCNFWVNDYLQKLYPAKGGTFMKDMTQHISIECYKAVKRDPSRFFQTEKRLFVRELGSSNFVRGLNQGVTVGTQFSLSTNHSTYTTIAKSWATKAGLGLKFMDLFSLGTDYSYQMSWSKSDGNASVNSISVNGYTSLLVQQNIMNLNVNKYEQCVVLRFNPKLFIETGGFFSSNSYASIVNPTLSADEAVAATTRGLFLCEGKVRNEPIQLTESFYLIAQETSSTQVQDAGDARNRTFFVALRSTNDFNRFLIAMKGQAHMPETAMKEKNQHEESANFMMQLFDMPGSSFPGMFLVK
jgi:hypothetical protein